MSTRPFAIDLIQPTGRTRGRFMAFAAAAALLAAVLFHASAWLRPLEERSRDGLTALALNTEAPREVLIIDISEESLQKIGNWPWSRSVLADLVEILLGPLGARGVALDMVLPEAGDPTGDARLASLASHAPLVLAQVLDLGPKGHAVAVGAPAGGAVAEAGVPVANGYVANHERLSGARCVGHIGVAPDADGVLRRLHLRAQAAQRAYATLSLALLECVDPPRAAEALAHLGGATDQVWRLPFRRDVAAFDTLPAESVLAQAVDPERVRGRYVLIGSSAVGLSDYIATPLQPVTAGVLVHAQALAELLEGSRSGTPAVSPAPLALLSLAVGLALTASAFAAGLRLGWSAVVLCAGAWIGISIWAFGHGVGVRVLPPLAAFIAFASAWTALAFAHSRRVSREALGTLSHYVAEPVLRVLVKQGLARSLTPSRQNITVLVADMAGYTRLTAEVGLEKSARLTTEFLEAITQPVLGGGGTLDRYTGDGLIAFWGAPLPTAQHAQQAFEAAEQMLAHVQALNLRRQARGEQPLAMRVGLESGEALVGDLGSSSRSVYTAVGNCINLASRLQELARDIGEPVVVGPNARAGIRSNLRPLGRHLVRGLKDPIELFGIGQPPSQPG